MSGYIKYFENDSKSISFLIKDDEVWDKYDKIWDVVKDKLGIKFQTEPVYEYKYLKAKVKEFDGAIKTNLLGNNIPKENMHYTYIACTIDSVIRINRKNHPQVYLEECKYRVKKTQMSRFINTELKSNSESSDSDLDDNELMTKFKKPKSHFANFKQVKKNSYFAEFEQKQIKHKTPLGETGYLSIYFFYFFIFLVSIFFFFF